MNISARYIDDRLTNKVAANLKMVYFIDDLTVQDVVVSMYTNMYVDAGAS